MTEQAQVTVNEGTIQFYDIDKLFFPEICFICGKKAENRLSKSILGNFSGRKESRKDYHLKIPICGVCENNRKIKTRNEATKVVVPSIFGVVGALIIYFLTTSIFMAIALGIVSFIFPLMYFMKRIDKQVIIKNHLQIQTKCFNKETVEDILQLSFSNKNYTDYLSKLNLKENKDLKLMDVLKENKKKKIAVSPTVVSKSGKTISKKISCPSCKTSNPGHYNFCIQCGIKMDSWDGITSNITKKDKTNIQCSNCNALISSDLSFCVKCGTKKQDQKIVSPTQEIISKGDKLKNKCIKCDALVSSALSFCLKCEPKIIKIPVEKPISEENKSISDTKKCPQCKKAISMDSLFCTKCGLELRKNTAEIKPIVKLETVPKPTVMHLTPIPVEIKKSTLQDNRQVIPDIIICYQCNGTNSKGSLFCTKCGKKLNKFEENTSKIPFSIKKSQLCDIPNKEEITEKASITLCNDNTKSLDIERLTQYKNTIQNVITPPGRSDSPERKKILENTNDAIKLYKIGQEMKAIPIMINALKLGVQEPEYSFIKRLILGYVDNRLMEIENKK